MAGLRIFLSHHHSKEEDAFTARLKADLRAAGADVWVDDDNITSDDFVRKINEGLAGRQWLVLVMTPDALRSPWVQTEVNAALNQVRKGRMLGVIPIVARPCDDNDIPVLWDPLHRYDATRDYPTARDQLLRALGLPVASASSPSAPPSAPRADAGARPVSPAPATSGSPLPAGRGAGGEDLPPGLARLGFAAYRDGAATYIVPPVVSVAAGEFLMGSDPKKDKQLYDDEKPQHRLTLPGFQIARYPVTVAEYACFVRSGHAEPKNTYGTLDWKAQLRRLDHPVVFVSWNDAVAYAAWLANVTRQSWRLPSEAEWEKAARGTDGRIYPWGDGFDKSRANTSEGGKGTTTPVGSYPSGASPYGAQDMAGNVWEWTSTLFKPYPYSPNDGRENVNSTGNRVLRGGSWSIIPRYTRAAYRDFDRPDVVVGVLSGFRLVLAVPNS